MKQEELKEILRKHEVWLEGCEGGARANLYGANLYGADLSSANLSGANLSRSNLSGVNLSSANLYGVNLYGANLYGANLSGANLSGANLSGADLSSANRREIKTIMLCDTYPITYTTDRLQIGCENHAIADWWEFTDKQILEMGGKTALKFWNEWRDTIRMLIEKSPATPTGHEV